MSRSPVAAAFLGGVRQSQIVGGCRLQIDNHRVRAQIGVRRMIAPRKLQSLSATVQALAAAIIRPIVVVKEVVNGIARAEREALPVKFRRADNPKRRVLILTSNFSFHGYAPT